ncbi:hypothetical protein ACH5RR_001137 [Cinchona calisaya]|uniref:AP2/ERF domain-containing protein n=1 Tax=Cinchona calisaya TaxID=153742 RepID=A0ABD3B352_9GENT
MKRSPSSCSSSSSCIEPKKTRTKRSTSSTSRAKKDKKSQIDDAQSAFSARRSSIYRGVTRHRWTGRFEAHLWDKTTWNSIQNKKGRQIYLGAYDNEEAAARTYDLAALKYWGPGTTLNFPIEKYKKELEEMQKLSKEEYLASLRRRSSGFSRGVSKYRGVARHHHNGRWEARIGRVFGNKYLYLGTYSTQEEAAAAYDLAAIEYRGPNAVTNFDISTYADKLKQFQQQMEPENFESSTPAHADKQEDHQEHPQEENPVLEPKVPDIEIVSAAESPPLVVMDPADEHEHPWNLCLDIGFNLLPVSDIPFEKPTELPDLFADTGFEDNIDFIFGAFEFNQEAKAGSKALGVEVDSFPTREEKDLQATSSPSQSSSSSLTIKFAGSNISSAS